MNDVRAWLGTLIILFSFAVICFTWYYVNKWLFYRHFGFWPNSKTLTKGEKQARVFLEMNFLIDCLPKNSCKDSRQDYRRHMRELKILCYLTDFFNFPKPKRVDSPIKNPIFF